MGRPHNFSSSHVVQTSGVGSQVGLGLLCEAGRLSPEHMPLTQEGYRAKVFVTLRLPCYPPETKLRWLDYAWLSCWVPCYQVVWPCLFRAEGHSTIPGPSGFYRDYRCLGVSPGSFESTEPKMIHSGSSLETFSQSIKAQ